MTDLSLNGLPEGETLSDLGRRDCAIGFDLRHEAALSSPDRIG
ncbi:hypothetical protein [Pseudogemmobacter sp. W21_MBD1_M6]